MAIGTCLCHCAVEQWTSLQIQIHPGCSCRCAIVNPFSTKNRRGDGSSQQKSTVDYSLVFLNTSMPTIQARAQDCFMHVCLLSTCVHATQARSVVVRHAMQQNKPRVVLFLNTQVNSREWVPRAVLKKWVAILTSWESYHIKRGMLSSLYNGSVRWSEIWLKLTEKQCCG